MKSKFNEEEARTTQIMTMKTKFHMTWLECLLRGSQSHELANMTTVWYVWNAQVQKNNEYESHWMEIMMRFAIARHNVTFFVSFLWGRQAPGAFVAFAPLNDQVKSQDETTWQIKKAHSQSDNVIHDITRCYAWMVSSAKVWP